METSIHPRAEDIEQIAATVFSTMLGLEFQTRALGPPDPASLDNLTASVQLDGKWRGTVVLHCQEAQAREFAARFLDMPPPQNVDDDVRDVLGELANMIAGNLKCTLQPGIHLSIPEVVDGPVRALGEAGTLICELGFNTEDGPFWLCAVEIALR